METSLHWAISCESIFTPKYVNEPGGKKNEVSVFPIIMAFSIQFLGMLLTAAGHNTEISGMLVQTHLSCVPASVGLEMMSLQRPQNRGY